MDFCNGLIMAHPELACNPKYKIIKKKHLSAKKVTLISGGGSGHEPAHAGFVGKGMLDAAVCGDVFASPSQIQIYHAIKETANEKGTLLIIKNYSGDVMNFKNARQLAIEDGIEVDYVIVNDDIAVKDSLYTVGRRGVAGTVLVHKVAGAKAEMGGSLLEVREVAQKAIANVRSIGFALNSCTVPAKGTPTFAMADDEMEYGVGIHGEPGIQREKVQTASKLANRMTTALIEDLQVKKGEEVAVLVNGFGNSPLQELYILCNEVLKCLALQEIGIHRVFVGNYMTSLDMAGASVSLLKVDEELKTLLAKPCEASGFPVLGAVPEIPYMDLSAQTRVIPEEVGELITEKADSEIAKQELSVGNMVYLIDKMGSCIIANEVAFCELDSHAGDGDFGMSVAKGFRKLKEEWPHIVLEESTDIGTFLQACALIIMEHCGGASGPIWGSAFRAAGKSALGKKTLTVAEMAEVLQSAVKGIQLTGERSFGRGAVVGDKTLIDALVPCADVWTACGTSGSTMKEAFAKGAKAAREGAKATEEIVARMGRAGTVGERSIGYPDAGAHALGVIFTELSELLF